MYNLQWDKAEPAEGQPYDWENTINPILRGLPPLTDLSLGLQKEPCYIADAMHDPPIREHNTWCDTKPGDQPINSCTATRCPDSDVGFLRAVPWDHFLRAKRDAFLAALGQDLIDTGLMGKLTIINTNLAGGNNGINNVSVSFDGDCASHPDNCMDGYTRERLLWAIQDELRTVQDNFPGKLVQIGFFKPTDTLDASKGSSLWQWLYRDATTDPTALDENGVHMVALFDEFNGIKRPRVSFWQDNLAATRTSIPSAMPPVSASNAPNYIAPPNTTAYTINPVSSFIPSFDFYNGALTTETYNNGIVFESNTIWSNPFQQTYGRKLIDTINGSPNDGLEGAFNTYLSQYLEVYVEDLDEAIPLGGTPPTLNAELWKGQLQSWHDYTKHLRDITPLEAPAGLTVERTSSTNNLIKWHAVYGATSYNVERTDLGASSPSWVNAGCNPTSNTTCTDTASTGTRYGYRVRAKNSDGSNITDYAYVAVFLSEGSSPTNYDGYVEKIGATKTPYNNALQPGIRAGQGSSSDLKGFLSFNTSTLGSTATILGAKLRLKQTTNDSAFDTFGACLVDIKKGNFNNNPALEGMDFSASASATNAAQIIGVGGSAWVESDLSPAAARIWVNNIDRTQVRLSFNHMNGFSNVYAGWNSAESVGNEPQLILQYKP